MADLSLLEHEREVERSRAKLTQDLAVLCSSDTFAAFTDDLKKEAVGMKDAYWEKLKARAAANPAAVIAIGAGLAWRLIQRPPIASALIGVGLFSLWKTEPKSSYDATGRRLDYMQQSKESSQGTSRSCFFGRLRHCRQGAGRRNGQRFGSLGRRKRKNAGLARKRSRKRWRRRH